MPASLIAVDWGSSSFRAYLMARDGAVLDEVASADGVSTVARGGFADILGHLIGEWLDAHADLPIVASGMVGSRHGWREAPYVKCPADPREIAAGLVAVQARDRVVHIAPGLSYEDGDGEADVMRGEEVEILGVSDSGARLVVLPGSHSKWATVEGGRVERFKTFVTGEMFGAIRDHTLAGAFARAAKGKPFGSAFALGVGRGAAAEDGKGSGLLGALFGARALPLMGKLAEDDAGEYLSGLLVGAEIAEARRLFPDEEPHVAGAESLVERYLAAFDALGQRARAAPQARRRPRAFPSRARRRTAAMIPLAPTPLIAILRGIEPGEAEAIAAVVVEAGFGVIEVPLNSPEPMKSVEIIARRFGGRTLVGAGTVLLPGAVEAAAAAGAGLIVAPNADPAVIERALKLGLLVLPGVATPTEAFAAQSLGASALKLFPAEAMPPEVVKAWRAVLPRETQLFPVGGITPERVAPYRKAGVDGFGIGGALYRAGMAAAEVERAAKAFVGAWSDAA